MLFYSIHFLSALVGLGFSSVLGGLAGVLEPLWLGGKGMVIPYIGSALLLIASVPSFFMVQGLAARAKTSDGLSPYLYVVSGFIHGAFGLFLALLMANAVLGLVNANNEFLLIGLFVLLFVCVIACTNLLVVAFGTRFLYVSH